MGTWIEKQRNILDFTLSSLLRRKGKNVALFLVYALVVSLLGSVMFFTYALKREASLILEETPDMVVQRMALGRHELIPVRYADEIRKIRGVSSVSGRLWGYYYDPQISANYTVMVNDTLGPEIGTIVIGNGVSRSLQVFQGDFMMFKAYNGSSLDLRVADVLHQKSELVSSDLIIVSEEDFRNLFGLSKDSCTDLMVAVRNPRELVTIAAKIAKLLPDTRPIIRDEILRTYDSIFDWRSGMMVIILFSGLLAFVIFAWDKASGLSAEEKREIGILKAIGWETSDVLVMKFWEGTVISLSAFLTGVILAYAHVFFASASLFQDALKGWSVLYPDFRLTPFVSPYQIATLFFLTVAPYTVATIVPSWRAATEDPDSIMRS